MSDIDDARFLRYPVLFRCLAKAFSLEQTSVASAIRCLWESFQYFPSSSRIVIFIKLKRALHLVTPHIRTRLGTVEKQPWHKLASMGMKTTVLHFSWPLVAFTLASVTRKKLARKVRPPSTFPFISILRVRFLSLPCPARPSSRSSFPFILSFILYAIDKNRSRLIMIARAKAHG